MKPITRKEKIIAGEQLTPITREEMFLQKYGGGASGGADWNASEGEAGYVKNRTHYEETTVVNEPLNITWDGNTEGLVSINNGFYKVSDLALTDEEIKLSTIEYGDYLIPIGDVWEEGLADGKVIHSEEATFAVLIFVARKDKAIISNGATELEIPEKGIYFGFNPDAYVSALTTTEPIEQTKTVVHKLDKKFLPKAETSDIVFTGVPNDEGWYDYICNVDYAKARKALIDGATARMILVSGKEIKHLTLQSVQYNDWRVKLNFFDIKDTNAEYGIINYNEDGSIGGGVE